MCDFVIFIINSKRCVGIMLWMSRLFGTGVVISTFGGRTPMITSAQGAETRATRYNN